MRPQRHRQAEGSSRGWFGRGRKQGLIGHWVFLVRQTRQRSWLHLSDEPAQDQGVFLKNNFIYLCIFPCSSVGRESACNADLGSISGSGRSPRGGNGNPPQYSCLENPTDKGAWQVWSMGSQESDMTEWLSTHTHTRVFDCVGSSLLGGLFSSYGEQGLVSSCGVRASHCTAFSGRLQTRVHAGFSSCGSWALEHRLSSCGSDLVALWHAGSSQTRNRTPVSCIGKWILYHWATRETPRSGNLSIVWRHQGSL